MGQYDRNDYSRRSDNRMTGDWSDDERRSRGESSHSESPRSESSREGRDNDQGFFERAANEVTSWFSSDDDRDRRDGRDTRSDAERERERQYERRYSTEGRGSGGHREWNSTFDTRYGANMEEDRTRHTNQDDAWRNSRDNTASWNTDNNDSRRQPSQRSFPERFGSDQSDGRESGRDYYNRQNQDWRSGQSQSGQSQSYTPSQSSPYSSDRNSQSSLQSNLQSNSNDSSRGNSGSTYSSYGRTGSSSPSNYSGSTSSGSNAGSNPGTTYGSSNYGSGSGSYGSSWSNPSSSDSTFGSANRGQHSGKGPKGYRRSDDRVKEDICEYLERNAMIDASEVDITVAEGIVTLTGSVPDRQTKRMCEDEIEHLPGVKDVNNQLRVNRESSSNSSSDSSSSRSNSSSLSGSGSTPGSSGSSRSDSGTSTSQTNGSTKKSGSSVA